MRLLFLLFAFLIADSVASFAQRVPRIEAYFQRSHSRQDLLNIKQELAVMGIRLDYEEMAFDEQGQLVSLSIFVDCHDGFSGRAHTAPVPEEAVFGFYRDYREGADSPFGVGFVKDRVSKRE